MGVLLLECSYFQTAGDNSSPAGGETNSGFIVNSDVGDVKAASPAGGK